MGREDVPSALRLIMISDENKNHFCQLLIFLIVYYLIDTNFITLYRKTNFEILTNFTRKLEFLNSLRKLSSFIADVRQPWTNPPDLYFEYLIIRFDYLIIPFDCSIIG